MLLHKETYRFRTRFGKIHALSTTVLNILRFGLVLPYWAVVRPLGLTQRDTPLQRSLLSICFMAPSRSSNVAGDSERTWATKHLRR